MTVLIKPFGEKESLCLVFVPVWGMLEPCLAVILNYLLSCQSLQKWVMDDLIKVCYKQ